MAEKIHSSKTIVMLVFGIMGTGFIILLGAMVLMALQMPIFRLVLASAMITIGAGLIGMSFLSIYENKFRRRAKLPLWCMTRFQAWSDSANTYWVSQACNAAYALAGLYIIYESFMLVS